MDARSLEVGRVLGERRGARAEPPDRRRHGAHDPGPRLPAQLVARARRLNERVREAVEVPLEALAGLADDADRHGLPERREDRGEVLFERERLPARGVVDAHVLSRGLRGAEREEEATSPPCTPSGACCRAAPGRRSAAPGRPSGRGGGSAALLRRAAQRLVGAHDRERDPPRASPRGPPSRHSACRARAHGVLLGHCGAGPRRWPPRRGGRSAPWRRRSGRIAKTRFAAFASLGEEVVDHVEDPASARSS